MNDIMQGLKDGAEMMERRIAKIIEEVEGMVPKRPRFHGESFDFNNGYHQAIREIKQRLEVTYG